jgi:hypothetical protein
MGVTVGARVLGDRIGVARVRTLNRAMGLVVVRAVSVSS